MEIIILLHLSFSGIYADYKNGFTYFVIKYLLFDTDIGDIFLSLSTYSIFVSYDRILNLLSFVLSLLQLTYCLLFHVSAFSFIFCWITFGAFLLIKFCFFTV